MPRQPTIGETSATQSDHPTEHRDARLVAAHLAARATQRRVLAATSLVCLVGIAILLAVLVQHGRNLSGA